MEIKITIDGTQFFEALIDSGEMDHHINELAHATALQFFEDVDMDEVITEALRYSSVSDVFEMDQYATEDDLASLSDELADLKADVRNDIQELCESITKPAISRELEELSAHLEARSLARYTVGHQDGQLQAYAEAKEMATKAFEVDPSGLDVLTDGGDAGHEQPLPVSGSGDDDSAA